MQRLSALVLGWKFGPDWTPRLRGRTSGLADIDSTDYVSGVTGRSEGSRGWLP